MKNLNSFEEKIKQTYNLTEADPAFFRNLEAKLNAQQPVSATEVRPTSRLFLGLTAQKWGYAIATLIIAGGLFLGLTPQGQAFAQGILQFFKPQETVQVTEESAEPEPLVEAEPIAVIADQLTAVSCLESPFPSCSLEEAQQHTDFAIAYPAELPADFTFDGAQVLEDGVMLAFSTTNGSYYLYESSHTDEDLVVNPVGDKADIQVLSVNGSHAEYVEGFWSGEAGELGAIPWEENDSVRTLIWTADEITFRLVSVGAQVYDSARPSPEQMAVFAQTLTPAAQPAIAAANGTTLEETEKQAGFTMALPAVVPPNMIKTNAVYNPAQGAICQFYSDPNGINNQSLVVAASPYGLLAPDDFQAGSYPVGPNGELFTPTMYIEHVEMPGTLNNKGIYINNGIRLTALCGEELISNHGLLWRKDGMSYYIFGNADGSLGYPYVTYKDLLSMANQISSVSFAELSSPDTERLTSLKDAESVWGEAIPFPNKMLAGFNFDHFRVLNFEGGDQSLGAIFIKAPVAEIASVYISRQSERNGLEVYGEINQTVWGLPAVYSNHCYDVLTTTCDHNLTWDDGNVRYELYLRTEKPIPMQQVLDIAESMKP